MQDHCTKVTLGKVFRQFKKRKPATWTGQLAERWGKNLMYDKNSNIPVKNQVNVELVLKDGGAMIQIRSRQDTWVSLGQGAL